MSRERVIVDIDSLGQALKVEQTVRTGYCDPIAENLLAWIAVEEDMATSYEKISQESRDQDVRNSLNELVAESRNNINLLHSMVRSMEQFSEARSQREKLIENLMDHK